MKLTLFLRRSRINEKGESEVFYRLRSKDGQNLISTDVLVKPKDFKNGSINVSHPRYNFLNNSLIRIRKDLDNIITDLNDEDDVVTPKRVKLRYDELLEDRDGVITELLDFWKGYQEYLETKKLKSYGYLKTLITLENHLRKFEIIKKRRITYEWITKKTLLFQTEFNDYLWNTKGLSNSYVNKIYDNLSGFLFYSHQNGYIKIKPKMKVEQTLKIKEKVYLQTDEVIKLFNSQKWNYSEKNEDKLLEKENIIIIEDELKGTNKKKYGGVLKITNWEMVKDIFLWLNSTGMRIGDVKVIRVSDMNFDRKTQLITWNQSKTKKEVSVPLNDISGFIYTKYSRGKSLDQHLFPKVSQQKFNKQLKNLLKDLRFNRMVSKPMLRGTITINDKPRKLHEMISSHSGRRGFIKNSIDMGNMDYRTIMELSGHSTFSEFSKYISVTDKDVLKSRGLYSQNPTVNNMDSKLLKMFKKLNDEQKKMIYGITESLSK
jgi:integrase|tara:strand:- start:49 stop:1512 length:1464 start_codon:yes stop_codon:yes gene_type:complete